MRKGTSFESIDTYSRAHAIQDGILVDVTTVALDVGIRYPVAFTRTVWESLVASNDEVEVATDSERRRLRDILRALLLAMVGADDAVITFEVTVKRNASPRVFSLEAACGPDDDSNPVVTVMFPWED